MSVTADHNLSGIAETLLLPLYIRAMESQRPDALIKDNKAVALIEKLNPDASWITKMRVDEGDKVGLVLCNREFDRYGRDFLARRPEAVVVHIGCGLDSRFERVDNGAVGRNRNMQKASPVSEFRANFKRMAVAIVVILLIAAIHIFRAGSYLGGRLFILYYSFFSDIVIPIAIYFLLCINEITLPFLRAWRAKATLVFLIASATEIAQGFGVPLLGNTFDILDFVMFGIGTLIAVGLDKLFSEIFSFWSFGADKARET